MQWFAISEVDLQYVKHAPNIMKASLNDMELMHALSAFLKSSISTNAVEDMMEVRQCLGGLGYSYYLKLGENMNGNDVHTTYEGDNKILL